MRILNKTILPKLKDFGLYYITLVVATLFVACSDQTRYHAYQSIDNSVWNKGDTVCFEAAINDSLVPYNVTLEIRNRNNYPYHNLGLHVECLSPDSTILSSREIEMLVADDNGAWLGIGIGDLYQCCAKSISITPKHAGLHRFRVIYNFDDEQLSGISDVGVRLESTVAPGI